MGIIRLIIIKQQYYTYKYIRQLPRSSNSCLSTKSFSYERLEDFGQAIFTKLGLPSADAVIVSRSLVKANLRGQDGHGVSRIPIYSKRLRHQLVNPTPTISIHDIAAAVASCDGDNGMGVIVARKAMEKAMSLARSAGIGMVGVKNSTHFGASAEYVQQALDEDMLCMVFTNSSPAFPPHGGAKAFLGASPIAAGAPADTEHPYLLDMAATVIARGKLRLASQRGEAIPPGIGLDKHGRPTLDGMEAFHGVTLPFGGLKGAALSMMMEVFAGVYTGAAYGGRVSSLYNDFGSKQDVGHLLIAMRCDMFMAKEEFLQRMDEFNQRVKAQPLAQGYDRILMVGELESNIEAARRKEGIPIQEDVVVALNQEAAMLHVDGL